MSLVTVFILAGMVGTILTLVQGIASMAHGGESDQARSGRGEERFRCWGYVLVR
jgi:hypothetical protein